MALLDKRRDRVEHPLVADAARPQGDRYAARGSLRRRAPPVWPAGRQAASGAAPGASRTAPSARRRVTPVLCFNMGSPPATQVLSSRPVISRARAVTASRGVR